MLIFYVRYKNSGFSRENKFLKIIREILKNETQLRR